LKEFLLTKAINAENSCHKSNKFKEIQLRTRFEYLNDLFTNYSTIHSLIEQNSNSFNSFLKLFKEKTAKTPEDFNERQLMIDTKSCLSFGGKLFQNILIWNSFRISLIFSEKFIIFLDKKRVLFVLEMDLIIGYLLMNDSNVLRLYYHLINENYFELNLKEIKEELNEFLEYFPKEKQIKELFLKRNPKTNSFGFHLERDIKTNAILIKECNDWAKNVNQLEKGFVLLEFCKISSIHLSFEQIMDLLKTSQTVCVAVIDNTYCE